MCKFHPVAQFWLGIHYQSEIVIKTRN